jgi:hypothetical protein
VLRNTIRNNRAYPVKTLIDVHHEVAASVQHADRDPISGVLEPAAEHRGRRRQ